MKSVLLAVVVALFGSFALASSHGDLVVGGYYLDDIDQSISPKLGLAGTTGLLSGKLSDSLYAGIGYLNPALAYQAQPVYEELKGDVFYGVTSSVKVGVGGGFIFNKQAYQSFDDHVHVTVSAKLW